MADFRPILKQTAKWEQGYQRIKNDKGNYNSLKQLVGTNRGISAVAYEDWIGRPPKRSDMKAITKELAEKIFRQRYWNVMNGDMIKNQSVASLMFYITMNAGAGRNATFVKRVLGKFGIRNINIRYHITPKVTKIINKLNSRKFHRLYFNEAYNFYKNGNPDFRNGWLNRLAEQSYLRKINVGKVILSFSILGTAIFVGYKKKDEIKQVIQKIQKPQKAIF